MSTGSRDKSTAMALACLSKLNIRFPLSRLISLSPLVGYSTDLLTVTDRDLVLTVTVGGHSTIFKCDSRVCVHDGRDCQTESLRKAKLSSPRFRVQLSHPGQANTYKVQQAHTLLRMTKSLLLPTAFISVDMMLPLRRPSPMTTSNSWPPIRTEVVLKL